MKKLIFAAMATWTLTLLSLGASAQTTIKTILNSPQTGLELFESGDGGVYYLQYDSDSSYIFSLPDDNLIFKCKGRLITQYLFSPEGSGVIYVSVLEEDITYSIDLQNNTSSVIANYTSFFYLTYGTSIIAVRRIEEGQELCIYNPETNEFSNTIISSFSGGYSFIRSISVVGNKLYFTTVNGNQEDVVYSYNFLDGRLSIIRSVYPFHSGKGSEDVFAFATRHSDLQNQVIFITSSGFNYYLVDKQSHNPGSFMTTDPDGNFIYQVDSHKIGLNFNGFYLWDKEYPLWSLKWDDGYVWTTYGGVEHEILIKKGDSTTVLGSFEGSAIPYPMIYDNKLYVSRVMDNQTQIISIDLVCPEHLTITQEMVNAGQTLFEAQHIDVKGIVNVSSDIIIRANNDIIMSPTSAFYVVDGGSVDIRPFTCLN